MKLKMKETLIILQPTWMKSKEKRGKETEQKKAKKNVSYDDVIQRSMEAGNFIATDDYTDKCENIKKQRDLIREPVDFLNGVMALRDDIELL